MSSLTDSFSLDSRYTVEEGTIILSGLQALVRVPLDQHRADQRAGLNTATFISGYRGSPLGSYDMMLKRAAAHLKTHNVVFEAGVNEDMAATAVFGSQLANTLPDPKYDGVLGIWYGKGPGVDRSGDAFRHAQMGGVGKYGGVLALAGDDPTTKSSTIPSHSEVALYDAQMPVLYPGTLQEIIEMGRYGFEMSRYTGSWSSLKIVTNVADSYGTAEVYPVTTVRPEYTYQGRPWAHRQTAMLLAPFSNEQEREIHEGRSEAIKRFAVANKLNRITVQTADDRVGLIASGKTYYDLRAALNMLGLRDADLNRYGIRLLKLGMITPIEPTIVKTFAEGLEKIFVIEEKRGFMELLIRDVLYNEPNRPIIIGKRDESGAFLVRGDMELDGDECVKLIASQLRSYLPEGYFESKLNELYPPAPAISLSVSPNGGAMANRTAYFCSGCPHNRSTTVPEGSLVGGGIGCHSLALLMDRNITGLTQMGGEGAQWVGMEPFTEVDHIFQNIGDGTLFHSGSLAIRQAVSAGSNVTYKILYNAAVAMTGGQAAEGEMQVPELAHSLRAEGVGKILIVADDPTKYDSGVTWPAGVEVWHRDRLDEAQNLFKDEKGVTALIYDQPCATELRRQRKRGQVEDPTTRIFINEAVCEGCGDCGVKSNCLSVFPVETEFGRKTRIHQSSCNKDYTCVQGDCPAFVKIDTINVKKIVKTAPPLPVLPALPEPRKLPAEEGTIYMMGIGGTGTVTVNQVLATAALLDGKRVTSLDQTGLSQKGGPVVSHLKIAQSDNQDEISNMIHAGEADAYLVFDLLSGTADKNLKRARADRTTAIVSSSQIPTGSMVKDKSIQYPQAALLVDRLERVTRADDNVYFDAIGTAERVYKNHMPANMIVIGAAYQAGLLPISAVAIEHAIKLNGVKVEMNRHAFNLGRQLVVDPEVVHNLNRATETAESTQPSLSPQAKALLDQTGSTGELARLFAIRIPELIDYQNEAYAQTYVDFMKQVMAADSGDGRFSQAVARYLFKLMAYKDEYEVARLYLKPEFETTWKKQFGEGATLQYLLHPPTLKALGWTDKIALSSRFKPLFRLLAGMKGLRGTRFDFFGRTPMRRLERELIGEYRGLIGQAMTRLDTDYENMVELAELPDLIRGFEELKWEGTEAFRTRAAELLSPTSQSIAAD